MLRKRYAALIALGTLPMVAGCVQATRHSNTMVFGTNTTLGLKVGQDANQVPEILFAYDREELVLMPLVANTHEKPETDNMLSPCSLAKETKIDWQAAGDDPGVTRTDEYDVSGSSDGIHPCKLVAIKAENGTLASQDSYSVLASFGASMRGSGSGTGADGAVGIAQYFATGVAAQLLAANGGAAVVAVGAGAAESAKSTKTGAATSAALGTEAVSSIDIPDDLGASFNTNMNTLRDNIRGTQSDADRARKIASIYDNIVPKPAFQTAVADCQTGISACLTAVEDDSSTFLGAQNFGEVLSKWAQY